MLKWFSQDTPVMRGLHTFASLVVLNLLWLLCSLPVFTVGASTTALYSCVFSLLRSEESGYRKFFSAFRSNFKTATLSWLIVLGAFLLLYADTRFTLSSSWPFRGALLAIYGVIALFLALPYPFLFPLISQFDAAVKQTLKNSFLCGLLWLPRAALILLLRLIPFAWLLVSSYWFLYFGWIWIGFGFAVLAYLSAKLMTKPMAVLKSRG